MAALLGGAEHVGVGISCADSEGAAECGSPRESQVRYGAGLRFARRRVGERPDGAFL